MCEIKLLISGFYLQGREYEEQPENNVQIENIPPNLQLIDMFPIAPQQESFNDGINRLEMNQKIMSDNQIQIIDNQKKIMTYMAELSVQFENLFQVITKSAMTSPLPESGNILDINNFELSLITNCEQLEEFEKKLSDPMQRKLLQNRYSIVSSTENANSCCFALLDAIFSRNFLTKCSWTGCARGEESKVCFKIYKNTINFFFSMIHSWNNKYTVEDNNSFLKSILKNATKRVRSKQLRHSTKRRRVCKPATNNETAKINDDAARPKIRTPLSTKRVEESVEEIETTLSTTRVEEYVDNSSD